MLWNTEDGKIKTLPVIPRSTNNEAKDKDER